MRATYLIPKCHTQRLARSHPQHLSPLPCPRSAGHQAHAKRLASHATDCVKPLLHMHYSSSDVQTFCLCCHSSSHYSRNSRREATSIFSIDYSAHSRVPSCRSWKAHGKTWDQRLSRMNASVRQAERTRNVACTKLSHGTRMPP